MNPVLDTLKRPIHDLRVSLTDRCNLRCTYCMPAEVFGPEYAFLPQSELLDFEELTRLVRLFVRLGVSKIRLTGGEPLLRPKVPELVARLASIPGVEDLALTTNAVLLPRYAAPLKAAGLHRINVSLDAMDESVFQKMSGGRGRVDQVLKGIAAARKENLDTKVNMVVERGVNESQILPMAEYFKQRGIPLRFIEFMDVGNVNGWSPQQVVPAREILEMLQSRWSLEPVKPAYAGEVARRYRYVDNGTEIGLITSVSQPFCGNCSRARLSADGHLFTCLFASQGHDLKPFLRATAPILSPFSDEEIFELLTGIWTRREDRYSELRKAIQNQSLQPKKVEMSYIGG